MDQSALEAIRTNVLDSPSSMIESNRDDIVALCDEVGRRAQVAGPIAGINWQVVQAIGAGTRSAPNRTIYQERLHLLQVFEALDLLQAAIDAKAPAPAPAEDPQPTPEE